MKPKTAKRKASKPALGRTSVTKPTKSKPKKKQATGKKDGAAAKNDGAAAKNDGAARKVTRKGSAALSAYFKTYKGGLGDFHIPIFRALKKATSAETLLYPGCHRHITASLFFKNVVYVDNYAKIGPVFTDEKVMQFVKENKEFPEEPVVTFKCKNFESDFGEKIGSFDLMLSLSAGIVSKSCAKYLKSGGYLLAGDAHYDARMSFVDPQFTFVAVYDDVENKFDLSEEAKSGHFVTTKGVIINAAMVQESIDLPKAKRHFKLQKETLFYLFQKK